MIIKHLLTFYPKDCLTVVEKCWLLPKSTEPKLIKRSNLLPELKQFEFDSDI